MSDITRAKCRRWIDDRGAIEDGFVEVEDVQDGTVSLAICDEDVAEVERTWLNPAKARRVARALIEAAAAIEGRNE